MISLKPPRISVCISSYNQKNYLIEAIESVLNQTLKPYEIIIVDDCSTDGSRHLIADYAARHKGLIMDFYNEENLGCPKTKSMALERARGDLVCYLDGDDRFLSRKLELEAKVYLEHGDSTIVYSNFNYIDGKGNKLKILGRPESPRTKNGDVFCQMFSHNIEMRNWLIDYESFKQVGFYDARFPVWSDWDLELRLTKRFKVAYCPEPLAEYRVHKRGLHTAPSSVHLKMLFGIYKKNRHMLADRLLKERVRVTAKLFGIMAIYAISSIYEAIGVKKAEYVIQTAVRLLRYCINYLLKVS